MPSIKPKIQGYVEPELFAAFEQWRIEQNKGISEALNDLLKEFFGFEKLAPVGCLSREQIEEMVEAKIQASLDRDSRFQEALESVRLQESVIQERQSTRLNQLLMRIEAVETALRPIEGLAEISHPCESPDNLPEDSRWKIGDRVRVICKSNYEGMPGTIIDFDERLGWHIAVDRWWEAVGISESVIDERQRRAGNIWCEPCDMKLLEEIPDNPPQSEEPVKKPPLTIPLTGLKQSELEQRLKLAKGILPRRRDKADFKEWSQRHDPQGVAWQWDAIAKKYLAVEYERII